jgi:hypothetical protein
MSTETSNTAAAPADSSGKKLVLAVILLGVLAAGASWWYRYSATRHSAEFWGSPAATLIRSAPHVTLRSDEPSPNAEGVAEADVPRDVSKAKGLTNLRDALLLDSKYDWTATAEPDTDWSSSLVFAAAEGAEPRAVVLFTSDFGWVANGTSGDPAKNALKTTSEMAAGLQKFFADDVGAVAEQ